MPMRSGGVYTTDKKTGAVTRKQAPTKDHPKGNNARPADLSKAAPKAPDTPTDDATAKAADGKGTTTTQEA